MAKGVKFLRYAENKEVLNPNGIYESFTKKLNEYNKGE